MVVADRQLSMQDHAALLKALLDPLQAESCYPHPVEKFTFIETHISSIILTGKFAYKLKKPLNLGFLDFSTLDKRQFCCEEELRLNQRLAPQLYLDVLPVGGSITQPVIGQSDHVIDYAIQMHEFPQAAQLDRLLENNALQDQHIDQLANSIARFHDTTAQAAMDTAYGNPQQVHQPVQNNFSHIRQTVTDPQLLTRLDKLEAWCQQRFSELQGTFGKRKQAGFIKECHGDMHLRNMVLLEDEVVLFDCIEFNPELRWIDTISDIAFLVMDLEDRQQYHLARRFLNRYLELTGDYAGIEVLDYYKVYRALVRAKVAAIRLGQDPLSDTDRKEALNDFANYLALAEKDTLISTPGLILTRGVSGTGKTFYSQQIVEETGAIRVRSDVERLRLFPENKKAQRYSAEASQVTYQHLLSLTKSLLLAGQKVIVDAAFLDINKIEPFSRLAAEQHLPFTILEFTASKAALTERISQRKNDASEATIGVMQHQLADWQTLPAELQQATITIDTEQHVDIKRLSQPLFQD